MNMTNNEAIEILLDMANELQLIPGSKQGQAFQKALNSLKDQDTTKLFNEIKAEIESIDIEGYFKFKSDVLKIIDKVMKEYNQSKENENG